ncbi:MAG: hypothetical protein EOO15_17130 [Chitinophagaceae bacterium]|nr:MAG: hypothetical protein EOO15_17130 [Chitinophagaceae bacterium]
MAKCPNIKINWDAPLNCVQDAFVAVKFKARSWKRLTQLKVISSQPPGILIARPERGRKVGMEIYCSNPDSLRIEAFGTNASGSVVSMKAHLSELEHTKLQRPCGQKRNWWQDLFRRGKGVFFRKYFLN